MEGVQHPAVRNRKIREMAVKTGQIQINTETFLTVGSGQQGDYTGCKLSSPPLPVTAGQVLPYRVGSRVPARGAAAARVLCRLPVRPAA